MGLILLVLTGCFTPRMGTWTTSAMADQQQTCGRETHLQHAINIGSGGSFSLDEGLGRTAVMTLADRPKMEMVCYFRGQDFHCAGEDRMAVPNDRDATVVTLVTASGRFEESGLLAGTLDITVGCEGSYCFALKLTGCTIERTFTATVEEP